MVTVALASGEVDQVVVGVAPALLLIRAGRVKPIVVLSGKRVAVLPDVPTSGGVGVPDFRMVDPGRIVRAFWHAAGDRSAVFARDDPSGWSPSI